MLRPFMGHLCSNLLPQRWEIVPDTQPWWTVFVRRFSGFPISGFLANLDASLSSAAMLALRYA